MERLGDFDKAEDADDQGRQERARLYLRQSLRFLAPPERGFAAGQVAQQQRHPLGLEWSRIQPKKDTWDIDTINHYREQIKRRSGRALPPSSRSGTGPCWSGRRTPTAGQISRRSSGFPIMCGWWVKEFGGVVDVWITMNEPMVPISHGVSDRGHDAGPAFQIHQVQARPVESHRRA